MSEGGEGLSEVRARITEREEEWAWHEQTDDRIEGYGWHMEQMLYRLPRDTQTLEQAMRGKPQDCVDRLIVVEKVLRDRADSLASGAAGEGR